MQNTQEQLFVQNVAKFVQSSEAHPNSLCTPHLCWNGYVHDFVKLEFHLESSEDEIVKVLTNYFSSIFKSEENVLHRFLQLHASVSVNRLNIVRLLPTFTQMQSHGLEKIISGKHLMHTSSVTENFSSLFNSALYNFVSKVFTDSTDDAIQNFTECHELYLKSVSFIKLLHNTIISIIIAISLGIFTWFM